MKKGFTAIEVILVLAISLILVTATAAVFWRLSNSASLSKDTTNILSLIQDARNRATNSIGGTEHGISFASSTVYEFTGQSYLSSKVENSYSLSNASSVYSVGLSNATTSFYFAKLTGYPSATGSVTIKKSIGNTTKNITIYSTGLAEIQ